MKTYRAAQSRFGSRLEEHDFGELYSLLDYFYRVYAIREDAVKLVLDTIAEAYSTEYGHDDPAAIKLLHNPRGAGRKKKISVEAQQEIRSLHKSGLSVREIAQNTGISKSTVQRILQ